MIDKYHDIVKALEALKAEELDCAFLANMVGYALQRKGHQVWVIEGEAEDLPMHYWLEVDGQRFDPWAYYYGALVVSYSKPEMTYPVYGPWIERLKKDDYIDKIWAKFLSKLEG